MYKIGTGKADITAFVKGVGMLGYGMHKNTMETIETPLSARAFVFIESATGRKVCFVNCELGFITLSLKKGVLRNLNRKHPNLNYADDNLMITAQHTHSGPSGYSYYGFYNLSTPGFVREIYIKIINGITDAIIVAEANLQDGNLFFGTGTFEPEKEVAFNRSLKQYNRNPEVEKKLRWNEAHLGVDREMALLKMMNTEGVALGCINWFGTHTTNISNDNMRLCYDNKGYAAAYFEEDMEGKQTQSFLAAFAQGNCGDVSPKFTYNPKHPFQRGKYEGKYPDDFESAKYNGRLQFEKAKEIFEQLSCPNLLGTSVDYETLYVNFTDVTCSPKFTNGVENAQTSNACLGTAFFGGTVIDGPGGPPVVMVLLQWFVRFIKYLEKLKAKLSKSERYKRAIERKYRTQGVKDIMVETHSRRVVGTKRPDRIIVPSWADPSVGAFKHFYRKVGHLTKPWTPKILPLQLFLLGEVALAGFPFEITNVAGKRLQHSLEEVLKTRGIKRVILCPYANGYSGYMTTNEEYQAQIYEGGHTVFGEWSLAALQTKFDVLAKQMLLPKEAREMPHDGIPPDFTEEELDQYPYYKRAWTLRKEKQEEKRRIKEAEKSKHLV